MDELPPHARRLLDAARTLDDPEPARRARADAVVRKGLAARGMVGLPALVERSAHAAAASGLRLSLGVKVALGLGAAVVLGAGVWQLRAAQDGGAQPPLPQSAASARAPELEPPAAPPVVEAPAAGAGAHVAQPRAKPSDRPARAPKPAAGDDAALRSELRLLAAVDGMLRNDRYRDALRALTDSEQRASVVVLSEERRALRVLALCGLARSPRALQERAHFLQHAPHSVLAQRVRAACETPEP